MKIKPIRYIVSFCCYVRFVPVNKSAQTLQTTYVIDVPITLSKKCRKYVEYADEFDIQRILHRDIFL